MPPRALPQASVSPGTVKRHVVAIPPAAALEVDPNSGKVISTNELPEWVQERLPEWSDRELILELTRPTIRLARLPHADAAAFLRRCNSGVWQRLDGSWDGITVTDVIARIDTPVEFALPPGMLLRSITHDGVDVAPTKGKTQSVLLKRSDRPQRVTLRWTLERSSDSGIPLPQPLDLGGAVPRSPYSATINGTTSLVPRQTSWTRRSCCGSSRPSMRPNRFLHRLRPLCWMPASSLRSKPNSPTFGSPGVAIGCTGSIFRMTRALCPFRCSTRS